jgi:hypothetical protein
MMGHIAALAYGVFALVALLVLAALLGSPVVAFWVVLAASSAYLCQTAQLLWPDSWTLASLAWFASLLFTVVAAISAGAQL